MSFIDSLERGKESQNVSIKNVIETIGGAVGDTAKKVGAFVSKNRWFVLAAAAAAVTVGLIVSGNPSMLKAGIAAGAAVLMVVFILKGFHAKLKDWAEEMAKTLPDATTPDKEELSMDDLRRAPAETLSEDDAFRRL